MPRIEKTGMDRWQESGGWKNLEKIASDIVSAAEVSAGRVRMAPVLGGGTRLMLEMNHRISRDIDLFIRDPQWIGIISPRLNAKVEDLVSGYEEDATFLKLKFSEGEIDFIVRMSLTGLPPEISEKSFFLLEPVEEVLAKKLFYRGAALTSRDLFDWACIESMRPGSVDSRRIARLVHSREHEILQSLETMANSSSARGTWHLIETPLEMDFDKTVSWGKDRIRSYRELFLAEKEGRLDRNISERGRRPPLPKGRGFLV
ncbi:MAG: nucleotidyl transferase AbiEii/AbiGii toxin family protein [Nitrospirae bacterium]|nr:MAG: hypothetical protein D084_Lepto4C00036G0007 [Leptospirillum sp. Group IV 'UBA BS']MCL4485687.1 nucleotidyl transferase AbiEii/AbiGii toxin family protein [Nitrospirota bacterium]MCL5285850.1 nucleotidyl transferase AbiEii/AbiGii toxin family protein [Nitrospirota bacterium]